MAERFYLKQHDLKPDLRVRLLDDALPVDLTNATLVTFLMSSRKTGLKVSAPMTKLDQTSPDTLGVVNYVWILGDTDTVGEFNGEIEVTWPATKKQTFPANTYVTIAITKDLG